MSVKKQVDKHHYHFEKYSHLGRWASYYNQIKTTLKTKPKNILEIGVGDSVFGDYIKRNTNIMYKSLDIDGDLNPDIVGSVLEMPFKNNEYDTVCVFEVLEHLPFEDFEKAMKEIQRVAKKYIVLSLPHFGPPIKLSFKVPFLFEIKIGFKVPFPIGHEFDGEHYWEVGKKGYSASKIRKILKNYGSVKADFVPFENQYHHFFVIKK